MNVPEIEKEKDETFGEDKIETLENDGTQGQTSQVDTPTPLAQDQDATKIKETENDKSKETNLTSKVKDLVANQALVTLPKSRTPSSQTLHRPRIDATPLHF